MTRYLWFTVPLLAFAFVSQMCPHAIGHGGGGGGARGGVGGGGGFGRGAGGAGFRGAGPVAGARGYPGYRSFSGNWGRPGYGWGRGSYGWGFPYYGYGLGLGFGLGYGLGYGYGSYGYPYYGYYGYDPYYYGSAPVVVPSGSAPYGSAPSQSAPSTTSPNEAPYNPYFPQSSPPAEGPPPSPATGADAVVSTTASRSDLPPPPAADIAPASAEEAAQRENAVEFARRGETLFHSGQYSKAAYAWRHAVIDDPKNPKLLLLLSQALFAMGRFNEAAGAAQAGMRMLPQDEWGRVIAQYQDLYGHPDEYTTQLRNLEKAIRGNPKDPALRFLLGYHYAFLGFRKEAIDQFDHVLNGSPRDEIAKSLRKMTVESLARSTAPTKS